jgi:C4-dicarboxylate-specific signal transduction histidine kinase
MLELEVDDKPAATDLIRRVQKAQDQLHRLFEELRGYVAPLQLDRGECQLSEVWREAWELLTAQRKGRQTTLRERSDLVDLRCFIDRFRLVQVFRNLLENALAACKDPVEIEIDCVAARIAGHSAVRVAVRDNGPGLNAEQRQRIFEPFFTTKTQGTGLGMAIALRIVEAHGGTLAVGEHRATGAEILLTLPKK